MPLPQKFSTQDAQLILDAAEAAPLQNLRVAVALSEALQRFRGHLSEHFAPAAEVPDEPRSVG